ncbi:MAG: chromosome partitioning protein [Solirubrobacteraceae bacterium]|jgi:cellulose biosynthesis protein BcsQ|nr:chromosome partitioning protein [Solirubrobacteraceae bacterium]
MTQVIALYNIKGGVGKTSASVNLAWLAAEGGARVLLWDLDPQGAATFLLRIRPKVKGGARKLVGGRSDVGALLRGTDHELLDLLPADFSYRNMDLELGETKRPTKGLARVLAPIAGDYDFVFLDCPPAISLASESVFGAADVLLVPLIPSPLSVRTFDQLHRFVTSEVADPPRILAFFSMADGRKRLHREVIAELSAAHGGVLATAIPAASDVERMALHRRVLAQSAPRGRAALAYEALWAELRYRL